MGYPTPLPYGTDPVLAAHMFLESYEKEAKVCGICRFSDTDHLSDQMSYRLNLPSNYVNVLP